MIETQSFGILKNGKLAQRRFGPAGLRVGKGRFKCRRCPGRFHRLWGSVGNSAAFLLRQEIFSNGDRLLNRRTGSAAWGIPLLIATGRLPVLDQFTKRAAAIPREKY
jgi:hypothetical protein